MSALALSPIERLVVDRVMIGARPAGRPAVEGNRSLSLRAKPDPPDRLAHQFRDAPARLLRELVQSSEILIREVDLRLDHGCHDNDPYDTHQAARKAKRPRPPRVAAASYSPVLQFGRSASVGALQDSQSPSAVRSSTPSGLSIGMLSF